MSGVYNFDFTAILSFESKKIALNDVIIIKYVVIIAKLMIYMYTELKAVLVTTILYL